MKLVFDNSGVVATWANRSQSYGRNQRGSIFFEHDVLYSYGRHFIAARFMKNDKGEEAVYINDRGYSSTTQRHVSIATQMTRGYKQFYATEIEFWLVKQGLEYLHGKVKRARKTELYTVPAKELYEKYKEYRMWEGTQDPEETLVLLGLLGNILSFERTQ